MAEVLGKDVTAELERLTRVVYTKGRDVALKQGIIIADTKFEFGRTKSGEILLIDEVMTPDSSRFWPLDGYAPGKPQPSFDKQPLARLARCRAPCRPLERRCAGAEAAGRSRRRHQQALPRSLSPPDRRRAFGVSDDAERWRELNRANWDERTKVHLGPGSDYDLAVVALRPAASSIRSRTPSLATCAAFACCICNATSASIR